MFVSFADRLNFFAQIETHHSATRGDLEGDRHVPGRFRALVGVTLEAAVEAVPRGVLQRAADYQLVRSGRPGLRRREAPDALALQQFRTARDAAMPGVHDGHIARPPRVDRPVEPHDQWIAMPGAHRREPPAIRARPLLDARAHHPAPQGLSVEPELDRLALR